MAASQHSIVTHGQTQTRRNLPKVRFTELCTEMVTKADNAKPAKGPRSSAQTDSAGRTKRLKQRAVLLIIAFAGLVLSSVLVIERVGEGDGTVKAPQAPVDVMALAKAKTAEMTEAETVCLPLVERSTDLVDEGTWDADGPASMYSVTWVTQCQAQNVTGANSTEDVGRVTCNGSTYIIKYKKNKDILRGRVAGLCVNDVTQEQSEFCSDWSKNKGQTEAMQTVCQLTEQTTGTSVPAAGGVTSTTAPISESSTTTGQTP